MTSSPLESAHHRSIRSITQFAIAMREPTADRGRPSDRKCQRDNEPLTSGQVVATVSPTTP